MNTKSMTEGSGVDASAAWRKLLEVGAPNPEGFSAKEAVFIWQMGKVGSSALARAIEKLDDYAVFHFHHTHPGTVNKVTATKIDAGVEIPDDLKLSQALLDIMGTIKSQKNEKINIISAVRDPIARNISAFFENLNIYAPGIDISSRRDACKLREVFLRIYPHTIPGGWYNRELRQTAGIDIYTTPFDHDKQALRMSTPPFELLILRAEDSDETKSVALNDFLGQSDIKLVKYNTSRGKAYAKLYSAFMDGLSFEPDFLSAQYDTKFCRHFYSGEELNAFKKRWA